MTRPLDRLNELTLVLRTGARDPLWDDFSLLGDEPDQPFLILVVDVNLLVFAETANTAFLELLIWLRHKKCSFEFL